MRKTVVASSIATIAFWLVLPANAADLDQAAPSPAAATTNASIDFVYATRELGDNHVIIEDTITGGTILVEFNDSKKATTSPI